MYATPTAESDELPNSDNESPSLPVNDTLGSATNEAPVQSAATSTTRSGSSDTGVQSTGLTASYLIDGEVPTGAMVALIPADPHSCCVEGGEQPEALHITSKYLGKAVDWDDEQRHAIHEQVEALAATTPPIEMKCATCEMFGEDDDALALEFDSPAASALHRIVHGLTPDVELKWPEYRPHLTLGYQREDTKLPSPKAHGEEWIGKPLVCDKIRVAFGPDVTDYPLAGAPAMLAAAGDGEVTDAEREQRRQAALKSAEARRKKAGQSYDKATATSDANKRAAARFFMENSVENSISDLRKRLGKPNLTQNERVMLQTALQIELENRRMMKVKLMEQKRALSKELALAEQELAMHSRVFDVDKMNAAQKRVDALREKAEGMDLGDEIVKIDFQAKAEAEREASRAAAQARREEQQRLRELKKRQSEAAKQAKARSKPKKKKSDGSESKTYLSSSERAALTDDYNRRHSS